MFEPIVAYAPSTVASRPSQYSGNADLPSATERAVMLVRQIASECKDCLKRDRECRHCTLEPARGIVQALELESIPASRQIPLDEKREKAAPPKKPVVPREGTRLRLAYDWLLANPGWHGAGEIADSLPPPKGRASSPDSDRMLGIALNRRGAVERRPMTAEERARIPGLKAGSLAFMYRVAARDADD